MAKLTVRQLRSGEGSILTRVSHVGPENLPDAMPDLFDGTVLLASADSFAKAPPAGAETVSPGLFAFRGDAARQLVRAHATWAAEGGIFGIFREMPDEDSRRRSISNPERPWDPERMKALCYAQLGPASRYAHTGTWFLAESDRRCFVETGVSKLLAEAGLKLPNGDVTLVLEMPTDSTFEAEFDVRGSGPGFSLRREFRTRGLVREWTIDRGEWRCVETRTPQAATRNWRERVISAVATTGIFILSIPTFLVVGVALLIAKFGGGSSTVSATVRRDAAK